MHQRLRRQLGAVGHPHSIGSSARPAARRSPPASPCRTCGRSPDRTAARSPPSCPRSPGWPTGPQLAAPTTPTTFVGTPFKTRFCGGNDLDVEIRDDERRRVEAALLDDRHASDPLCKRGLGRRLRIGGDSHHVEPVLAREGRGDASRIGDQGAPARGRRRVAPRPGWCSWNLHVSADETKRVEQAVAEQHRGLPPASTSLHIRRCIPDLADTAARPRPGRRRSPLRTARAPGSRRKGP